MRSRWYGSKDFPITPLPVAMPKGFRLEPVQRQQTKRHHEENILDRTEFLPIFADEALNCRMKLLLRLLGRCGIDPLKHSKRDKTEKDDRDKNRIR